jgi:hypothetical protein
MQLFLVIKVRNQSAAYGPSAVVNSPIALISLRSIFTGFNPAIISIRFSSISLIRPYFSSFSMIFFIGVSTSVCEKISVYFPQK